MESAREVASPLVGSGLQYSVDRNEPPARRPETVILQVDSTLSAIDGLAWLVERRAGEMAHRLAALQREAAAERWSWAELTRARLKHLRPRRAEINELGAAYLASLVPGAADAVRALRRAGISVALSSDLAAEALFGVATALGVSPDELQAPRLRFDAIGAYVGCDLGAIDAARLVSSTEDDASAARSRTLFVGSRRSAVFAPRDSDAYIAFSGVIAREGQSDAVATIASFHDLAALVLR